MTFWDHLSGKAGSAEWRLSGTPSGAPFHDDTPDEDDPEETARLLAHAIEELHRPAPQQSEVDAMSVALLRKSNIIRHLIEKVSQL